MLGSAFQFLCISKNTGKDAVQIAVWGQRGADPWPCLYVRLHGLYVRKEIVGVKGVKSL